MNKKKFYNHQNNKIIYLLKILKNIYNYNKKVSNNSNNLMK